MKVIIIYSGKGGVGKTTTTANLAKTLAKQGKSVFIIDADVNTPSMNVIFKTRTPEKNLYVESTGFDTGKMIYMESSLVRSYLKNCINKINDIAPDYVLVDTPPSITDVHINLIEKIDVSGLIVVTQPNDLSIADVNRTITFFDSRGVKIIGIVENMSVEKSTTEYKWKLLGTIPFEEKFNNKNVFDRHFDEYAKIADFLSDDKLEAVILANKKTLIFDENIELNELKLAAADVDSSAYDFISAVRIGKNLKFTNLETWDITKQYIQDSEIFPDRLLDETTTNRVERLIKAFEYDEQAFFMITNAPNTEINLLPGEIGECSLRLDDKHYGIPRVLYRTKGGTVTLFPHEVMPVTQEDINLYLAEGYTISKDGRYIPPKDTLQELENAFGHRVGLMSNWEKTYNSIIK